MNPSMAGKWDYSKVEYRGRYGECDSTYQKGMAWLEGCATIEDWGCGMGWAATFTPKGSKYIGVDGSKSKFSDVVADLVSYRSQVDGIFMRHVLEHNYDWREILRNAVASAPKRMSLIVFTPFVAKTTDSVPTDGPYAGIPDICFCKDDLIREFAGMNWKDELVTPSKTPYGSETVFYLSKCGDV